MFKSYFHPSISHWTINSECNQRGNHQKNAENHFDEKDEEVLETTRFQEMLGKDSNICGPSTTRYNERQHGRDQNRNLI